MYSFTLYIFRGLGEAWQTHISHHLSPFDSTCGGASWQITFSSTNIILSIFLPQQHRNSFSATDYYHLFFLAQEKNINLSLSRFLSSLPVFTAAAVAAEQSRRDKISSDFDLTPLWLLLLCFFFYLSHFLQVIAAAMARKFFWYSQFSFHRRTTIILCDVSAWRVVQWWID